MSSTALRPGPGGRIPARPSKFVQSILAAVALGIAGGLLVWALDLGSGAYFGVAVIAALFGGSIFARDMVAEAEPRTRKPRRPAERMAVSMRVNPEAGRLLHPQLVVTLIGHSGSGKTAIAEAVAKLRPDWAWASCGAFVVAEAKRRGLSTETETTDAFGAELVAELGPDPFIKGVLEHAQVPVGASFLIIDDVYHEAVFRAVEHRWHHMFAVSVKVPRPSLLQRALARFVGPRTASEQVPGVLDREAEQLLHGIRPALVIEGAIGQRDAVERGSELVERLVAPPAPAAT